MDHNDPQQCAKDLVEEALRRHTTDNVTAVRPRPTSHLSATSLCLRCEGEAWLRLYGCDELLARQDDAASTRAS